MTMYDKTSGCVVCEAPASMTGEELAQFMGLVIGNVALGNTLLISRAMCEEHRIITNATFQRVGLSVGMTYEEMQAKLPEWKPRGS